MSTAEHEKRVQRGILHLFATFTPLQRRVANHLIAQYGDRYTVPEILGCLLELKAHGHWPEQDSTPAPEQAGTSGTPGAAAGQAPPPPPVAPPTTHHHPRHRPDAN